MIDAYIGQILPVGFYFNPVKWANCDGTLIAVNQNQALFALLGDMYGGDGRTNFAVPDLRGRVAKGSGTGPGLNPYKEGWRGGTEIVQLDHTQMPLHNHKIAVSGGTVSNLDLKLNIGVGGSSTGRVNAECLLRKETPDAFTKDETSKIELDGAITATGAKISGVSAIASDAGGTNPVGILNPYTAINYIIALEGTFPPRN